MTVRLVDRTRGRGRRAIAGMRPRVGADADPADPADIDGWIASQDGDGTDLAIRGLRQRPGDRDHVRLRLIGRHMAIDGLMAAGGALAAGVDPDAILAGLASFEGVGRRFELKGDVGGVVVLDDYAHHPTAMRATFAAARHATRAAGCGPSTSR